jgi:hypothetical protein
MANENLDVCVNIRFTDQEAWDLAQFLKRAGFTDYRSNAVDDAEAYRMLATGEKVKSALAECGYRPR